MRNAGGGRNEVECWWFVAFDGLQQVLRLLDSHNDYLMVLYRKLANAANESIALHIIQCSKRILALHNTNAPRITGIHFCSIVRMSATVEVKVIHKLTYTIMCMPHITDCCFY